MRAKTDGDLRKYAAHAPIKAEPFFSRDELIDMDLAFKLAMLEARRRGLERFTLGVVTAPGTDYARTMRPIALPPRSSTLGDIAANWDRQCFPRKRGRKSWAGTSGREQA